VLTSNILKKERVTWMLARVMTKAMVSVMVVGLLIVAGKALAQDRPAQQPTSKRLSAKEMTYLLVLAKEPLNAFKEGREVRPLDKPSYTPGINQTLPTVVTLWLDGQILARAWEIRQPQPLNEGVLTLAAKVLDSPNQGRVPTMEECLRVKVGVAVLHNLEEAYDDKAIGLEQAVVILEGFTMGIGLPKDMPPHYKNSEMLSKACQMAGLRPNIWLLPDKCTIFAADVDEVVEK
jgi:hypothetical protein